MNWSSNLPQSLKQRAVALGEIAASHLCGSYVQQGWQAEQGRLKILRRRVTWVAPPRRELLWSAAMKLSLSDHLVFLLLAQGAGPISAAFLVNYWDANCINARGSTCTSEHKQLKVELVKHEELSTHTSNLGSRTPRSSKQNRNRNSCVRI